jgi:hypothetical protein
MTKATHIGNSSIGSVRGMMVNVVSRVADRRGDVVVRYVDLRGDGTVLAAPGFVFDHLFRSI